MATVHAPRPQGTNGDTEAIETGAWDLQGSPSVAVMPSHLPGPPVLGARSTLRCAWALPGSATFHPDLAKQSEEAEPRGERFTEFQQRRIHHSLWTQAGSWQLGNV